MSIVKGSLYHDAEDATQFELDMSVLAQVACNGTVNIKTSKGVYRIAWQSLMNKGHASDGRHKHFVVIDRKHFAFTANTD